MRASRGAGPYTPSGIFGSVPAFTAVFTRRARSFATLRRRGLLRDRAGFDGGFDLEGALDVAREEGDRLGARFLHGILLCGPALAVAHDITRHRGTSRRRP